MTSTNPDLSPTSSIASKKCPACGVVYDATWVVCLKCPNTKLIIYDFGEISPLPSKPVMKKTAQKKAVPVKIQFTLSNLTIVLLILHALLVFSVYNFETNIYQGPRAYGGWSYLYLVLIDPITLPLLIFVEAFFPDGFMVYVFLLAGSFQWYVLGEGITLLFKRNPK